MAKKNKIFQKIGQPLVMAGAEPIFLPKNSKVGILLLHGFTGTPYQFREFSAFLNSKGVSVSAPLLAGHGTSPADMIKTSPEDWKNSVEKAYLELKKISPKIFIVGNSFGGNLAFWLAKKFNNEVAGIISLGTPIVLKWQKIIKIRYYLYGWMKTYYRKPQRIYKTDYTDMEDEITYSLIPMKNFIEFLNFIKRETLPILPKITVPSFVIHSRKDSVVNPKSALYIYEHLGSSYKKIHWFGEYHNLIIDDKKRTELFEKIWEFIKEING